MTTTGYGDIIPKTSYGAMVGYITMLCGMNTLNLLQSGSCGLWHVKLAVCAGMIAIALPISVIASKLSEVYKRLRLNIDS